RVFFFFFQAEDGIRDRNVTGVQTCALPIWRAVLRRPPAPPLRLDPDRPEHLDEDCPGVLSGRAVHVPEALVDALSLVRGEVQHELPVALAVDAAENLGPDQAVVAVDAVVHLVGPAVQRRGLLGDLEPHPVPAETVELRGDLSAPGELFGPLALVLLLLATAGLGRALLPLPSALFGRALFLGHPALTVGLSDRRHLVGAACAILGARLPLGIGQGATDQPLVLTALADLALHALSDGAALLLPGDGLLGLGAEPVAACGTGDAGHLLVRLAEGPSPAEVAALQPGPDRGGLLVGDVAHRVQRALGTLPDLAQEAAAVGEREGAQGQPEGVELALGDRSAPDQTSADRAVGVDDPVHRHEAAEREERAVGLEARPVERAAEGPAVVLRPVHAPGGLGVVLRVQEVSRDEPRLGEVPFHRVEADLIGHREPLLEGGDLADDLHERLHGLDSDGMEPVGANGELAVLARPQV